MLKIMKGTAPILVKEMFLFFFLKKKKNTDTNYEIVLRLEYR